MRERLVNSRLDFPGSSYMAVYSENNQNVIRSHFFIKISTFKTAKSYTTALSIYLQCQEPQSKLGSSI